MNLITLRTKIVTAQTAINKAIAVDSFKAYKSIYNYYQTAIDKIDAGEQLSERDIIKISAGGRMLYEAPLKNQKLMDEILVDLGDLYSYISNEYWKKQ